jgi:preprotein translocase SecE subunit
VARDRQRAKQRRKRQAQSGGRGGSRASAREARRSDGLAGATPAPDPLEHASADVDEAKLAEQGPPPPPVDEDEVLPAEPEDADEDFERAPDEVEGDLVPGGTAVEDPAVAEERAEAAGPRRKRGRFITFLGHVVDELRRVQWPNRRQTGQGTAVTLGFVIIAGGYLGLMDAIWKPLVEAIL